jgi:protein-L-isoaspartate(D-aspartate) O-methyltransferase
MTSAEEAHHRFVDYLIARGSLWSRPLIAAFRATPRHLFLDRIYHYQRHNGTWREVRIKHLGRPELKMIYTDRALTTRLSSEGPGRPPVPISSSSQPSLMAQMLEDLRLERGLRILEVGAGTGYNAALLAHLAESVISIDVDRRVLAEAQEHLRAFPERAVEWLHADGREGYPAKAPYDRIMVTAATPDLEPAWLRQIREGGLVQAPLVLAPSLAYVVQGTVRSGWFEGRLTRPAYFMPLREENEAEPSQVAASEQPLPSPEGLEAVHAPWTDWGRKFAANSLAFLPALAFFGWLHGYTFAYHSLPDGRAFYGIGDPEQGSVCWLGVSEWRVQGSTGRELGRELWRTWLDAGGPWPTEFQLRIPLNERTRGEWFLPTSKLCFRRRGPINEQCWVMLEPRKRPMGF